MKQLVLLRDQKLKRLARQRGKKKREDTNYQHRNKSEMKCECVYTPCNYKKKKGNTMNNSSQTTDSLEGTNQLLIKRKLQLTQLYL